MLPSDVIPRAQDASSQQSPRPTDAQLAIESSRWGRSVPWITTGISLLMLAALAIFLVENVYWFRTTALKPDAVTDPAYSLYVFQLHGSLLKRSVGLFAGFSMVFVGSSIVFYTLRSTNTLEASGQGVTAKLATASPGLVAMVLGTALLAFTIWSKDTFPGYTAPSASPAPSAANEKAMQPEP